jgi:DNA-binding MarR family transcriptional regulator
LTSKILSTKLIVNVIDYQQRLTKWMDNTESAYALAEQLMRIMPSLGRVISLQMREAGEDDATLMQVSILHQIQQHPMTASDLAKGRKVSLQAMSVLIHAMGDRGWIVRVPDANDKRRYLLQIAPEGKLVADATFKQLVSAVARLLQNLSSEEIAAAQIFLPALHALVMQHMAADQP